MNRKRQSPDLVAGIVLAAGKGTRMKSDRPKVLFPVGGIPMVRYPISALKSVGAFPIVVIVGHRAEMVKEALADIPDLVFVRQEPQLGTAHAVSPAHSVLQQFSGSVLILSGDVPLIRAEDLAQLIQFHREGEGFLTVVTAEVDNPAGYGRIVRNSQGKIVRIVEELDANAQEKGIREINGGIYLVNARKLFALLTQIRENPKKGEYYLTDLIALAAAQGEPARAFRLRTPEMVWGVNTMEDLKRVEEFLGKRQGFVNGFPSPGSEASGVI